jgi:hypothetical protein
MSTKRKSPDTAECEIKEKKACIGTPDPPSAFLAGDPFSAGTAELGVDPFDRGVTLYNDPVPRAPKALRDSTVIETNRTVVWLLINAECNTKQASTTWEMLPSMPLIHWASQEPVIVCMIKSVLGVSSAQGTAQLADLVWSYVYSRGVSYVTLWRSIQALFYGLPDRETRELFQLPLGIRLSDCFDFSRIVGFELGTSYDGEDVVVWPLLKLVHS